MTVWLRGVAAAGGDVHAAIRRAWQCGRRWWTELARRHGSAVPQALSAEIDGRLPPRG